MPTSSTHSTITSSMMVLCGKGGVGKTTVVANLAIALARLGHRVLVLDADFSLANIDVLLGLVPSQTIQHFFAGVCSLSDLMLEGPSGIHVIPAASGVPEFANIDPARRRSMLLGLEDLRRGHDWILIDAPAGIGENVLHLATAADRTAIVVGPEPTSLVDAYATIKVLAAANGAERLGLIVNASRNGAEADSVHSQMDQVCRHFLGAGVDLIGQIVHDKYVREAAQQQHAVVEAFPNCEASQCFQRLAVRIGQEGPGVRSMRLIFPESLGEPPGDPTIH